MDYTSVVVAVDTDFSMAQVVAVAGCYIASAVIGGISWLILHEPQKRVVPRILKHRWFFGIAGLSALPLIFVIPFVVIGAYSVALAGASLVMLFTATIARIFLVWLIHDVHDHRVSRRSLFSHSRDCMMNGHPQRKHE